MTDTVSIETAQQELAPRMMALSGVVGVGIGECEGAPCIVVYVAERTQELVEQVPSSHRGYRVEARVMGEPEARDDPSGR